MSDTRFLRQFHATGREKADGYDPGMFEEMSTKERARAAAMLLVRGLAGDTTDLHGLRYLGGFAAVAALRDAAGTMLDAGCDIERCDTLFALTGDPADLLPVLGYLDGSDTVARERAAWVLAGLRAPAALAEPIAERLADRRYRPVELPLAAAWLATQGLPVHEVAGFQAHLPLVRRILDAAPRRRPAVLAGIARELLAG